MMRKVKILPGLAGSELWSPTLMTRCDVTALAGLFPPTG